MPRKDEPEKAETRQRENGRLKFAPDSVSFAHPRVYCVIEYDQRTNRSENANHRIEAIFRDSRFVNIHLNNSPRKIYFAFYALLSAPRNCSTVILPPLKTSATV